MQFGDYVFPAHVFFAGATFSDGASFEGATFAADAFFGGATFSAVAFFDGATFFAVADFKLATFYGASFERATFSAVAQFMLATFLAVAQFEGATFKGSTHLHDGRFKGPVDLSQAKFLGAAGFDQSTFENAADFGAIDSQAAFSLADVTFHQVPSFIGATFRGGLRLDNVQTPRLRRLGWTSDKDAAARFRELKRRANEAQDRDRELEYFAQEIRTSRFHAKGFPAWVPRIWEWRFWFGLLFGTFSNFGRSLWRPLLFWLALLVGFAAFYLGENEDLRRARAALNPDGAWGALAAYTQTTAAAWSNPPACRSHGKEIFATTNAVTEALNLSLANAMVFDGGRANASRRTYGCLYGFETVGDQEYPKVSSRVSRASTAQSLASAVLIFLFLLAVRNLLRLK